MFKKPDEWVVPLKDKTIKEIQDKEVVFTATFSKADQKATWAFKGDEIFHGKQHKIELLEDESKEKTIHQLTIKKPMFKNQGKYTVTCNEVQTGAYLDVEGNKSTFSLSDAFLEHDNERIINFVLTCYFLLFMNILHSIRSSLKSEIEEAMSWKE